MNRPPQNRLESPLFDKQRKNNGHAGDGNTAQNSRGNVTENSVESVLAVSLDNKRKTTESGIMDGLIKTDQKTGEVRGKAP
jgi:hypothetical protein